LAKKVNKEQRSKGKIRKRDKSKSLRKTPDRLKKLNQRKAENEDEWFASPEPKKNNGKGRVGLCKK